MDALVISSPLEVCADQVARWFVVGVQLRVFRQQQGAEVENLTQKVSQLERALEQLR